MQVDAVGCSYNPPEDARQDVIAAELGALTKKKLKEQLEADGISIPFPQQTVHHVNQAAE